MYRLLTVPTGVTPTPPPGAEKWLTLLNWGAWACLFMCLLGFLISAAKLGTALRHGGEVDGAKGLVLSLVGCALVGSASAITAMMTGGMPA